jgi:ABC-2 type transport system ATP-binding protein
VAEQPAVRAEGLVKRFGPLQALAGVDLQVPAGAVVALLGPNGAGKTTIVRILATLLRPDAGRAEVTGLDMVRQAAAVRLVIGLTGQYTAVDAYLTGRENLRMIGRLSGLSRSAARRRADELLELTGLADAAELLIYRVFLTVPQGTPGIHGPLNEQRRNEPRAQGTCLRLSQ